MSVIPNQWFYVLGGIIGALCLSCIMIHVIAVYQFFYQNRRPSSVVLKEDIPKPFEFASEFKQHNQTFALDDFCSICLAEFDETTVQSNTCGHCFHSECIKEWVARKDTCPNCLRVYLCGKVHDSLVISIKESHISAPMSIHVV
jgi:hypothetical protein